MSAIHVDGVVPGAGLDVVVLGLLEVALHLQLLSQVLMSVLQEVLPELGDQADHVIVLLRLLVHVDGKVGLVCREIHSLCILEETLTLEFAGLLDIEHGVLGLWQVARDDLVGLVPFVRPHIHLKGLNKFSCIDEVLFGKVKLTDFSVVSSNLLVVRSADLRWLVSDQLHGPVPFSGTDGSLNGL